MGSTKDDPFRYFELNVRRTNRRHTVAKGIIYIALFSFILTASHFLPTPWSIFYLQSPFHTTPDPISAYTDPASEWKDNIWPLREQTPWDISTDFPYPRRLQYDVQEGTWLRLDVHPKSGDIVFDMIGDLYCLPANDAFLQKQDVVTRARPVLLGIPYDSDPHFSPSGDRLVFRSDAELGVENIWVMEWKGCTEMDVGRHNRANANLDEDLLANGVKETPQRTLDRLLREGRHGAQRVTNETYRWITDARFHPSGSKVIATKWFTSGRSLGAGEGWEYPIPPLNKHQKKISPGSGSRLLGRTLPPGWTVDQYGDQQIGPEQFIWSGNDSIIYSKNIRDESTFSYSKDVHTGIYAIFQKNLTTGTTQTLVDASPGGANRPELSRDGRTLAFVRRVRDKEALVLKDLKTGTINHAWHGLTYDTSGVSAPMGTYPSFSFTKDDSAVIIWAAGQIYSVPLSVNERGEKVASTETSPFPIRFTAHIEKRLAKTRHAEFDIKSMETRPTQRVRALKELRVDESGNRVVFQAAGASYIQKVDKKDDATKVPVLQKDAPYYSPSFVHGAKDLVIHARWSDTQFTSFELADVRSKMAWELTGLPLGRYFSPVLCQCDGRQRKIAFIRTGGDLLSGDVVATAGSGLYIGTITLPETGSTQPENIPIRDVQFIPSEIDTNDHANLVFLEKFKKLLVQQSSRAFIIDLFDGPDDKGAYKHTTLAKGRMSTELATSTSRNLRKHTHEVDSVAFVDFFHVYFATGKDVEGPVWSKPGNATKGLARLSLDGGHDVTFSGDGKKVFWLLGPYLHSLEISKLKKCSSAIKDDQVHFGISCVKDLLQYQEVVVEHSTDIERLRQDVASLASKTHKDWLQIQPRVNSDVVVIMNATILTMESGQVNRDLIQSGNLIVSGGVIESVNSLKTFDVPAGATVIDAEGGYVIPGFIDVHAHWSGFGGRYPSKSWELETFLAYGVTTLHNPSADNVEGFDERSRVEKGQMIGPRIFTVGDIVYGAGEPGIHQDIIDLDEAHSALARIKAEGGPASISYKNYNLPSRASRQRLLLAARNLSMLCVPEAGMNYDWDLTYIIDGMTTVEHALPIGTLYDDVQNLFALSGTGSTPTHIVNYGGAWGEQWVWAKEDIPNDPKLRKFTRHDILETLSESTARPSNSFNFFNTSASTAQMVEKGLHVHIGAHGEPPLGVNYHAEMFFTKAGGLSNYEVLRAATSSAAYTLGMFSSLGSISTGKLADFLVYTPDADLLEGDISDTRKLRFVARGGRIWDASTMVEVWPMKGRKQEMPPINAE